MARKTRALPVGKEDEERWLRPVPTGARLEAVGGEVIERAHVLRPYEREE